MVKNEISRKLEHKTVFIKPYLKIRHKEKGKNTHGGPIIEVNNRLICARVSVNGSMQLMLLKLMLK